MSEAPAIDLSVLFPQGLPGLPASAIPEEAFGDLLRSLELPSQARPLDPDTNVLLAPSAPSVSALLPLPGSQLISMVRPAQVAAARPAQVAAARPTAAVGEPQAWASANPPPAPLPSTEILAPRPVQFIVDGAPSGPPPAPSSAIPGPLPPQGSAPPLPAKMVRAALKAAASTPPAGASPAKIPAPAGGQDPDAFQARQMPAPVATPAESPGPLATGAPGPRFAVPALAAKVSVEAKLATAAALSNPSPAAGEHSQTAAGTRPAQTTLLHAGPELGHQLGERLAWMVRTQTHSAEIKIWPRNLGSVRINLSVEAESVEIVIEASNPRMLEELHQATPRLRSLMSEQGLGLTHLEIDQQPSQDRHAAARHSQSEFHGGETGPEKPAEQEPSQSGGGDSGPAIHRLVDVFA